MPRLVMHNLPEITKSNSSYKEGSCEVETKAVHQAEVDSISLDSSEVVVSIWCGAFEVEEVWWPAGMPWQSALKLSPP